MANVKEWAVDLIVTTEHSYTVLARTEEEAVDLAEELLDSGDEGEITAVSIENADAISADSYVEPEYEEPEETSFEAVQPED